MALAVVRDLRERRQPATAAELEAFETVALAGFVLARASAGLAAVHAARPLDDLTSQIPLAWLEYRRSRWPNTANAHVLISKDSALDSVPSATRGS